MAGLSHQHFVGREKELAELFVALDDPDVQAMVVVGHEGMGKTWLINEFFARLPKRRGRSSGVRYLVRKTDSVDNIIERMLIDIYQATPIKRRSADDVDRRAGQLLSVLASAKGVKELVQSLMSDYKIPTRDKFIAVAHKIAERMKSDEPALYIIDPYETLVEGSRSDWAALIEELPKCFKFLFAQRPNDALVPLCGHSADSLFRQVPRRWLNKLSEEDVKARVAPAAKTNVDYERIVNALAKYDGHPFAVNAALGLIARWEKRGEKWKLPPDSSGIADAQWSEVFADGDNAVAVFRSYAVFASPVDEIAAMSVCGLSSNDYRRITKHDPFFASLLEDYEMGTSLYHALLRNVIIADSLQQDLKPFHERAVEHFLERVERCRKSVPDVLAAELLPQHLMELGNPDQAVKRFVRDSTPILMKAGHYESLFNQTADLLARFIDRPDVYATLTSNLVIVYRLRGDLDKAEIMCRKVLALDEALGDKKGLATNYGHLASIYLMRGDLEAAEENYLKALVIEKEIDHKEGIASNYCNLGTLYRKRGDLNKAEEMYRKSAEIYEAIDHIGGLADCYGSLGMIFMVRGDFDRAEEMYHQSLDIEEKLGRKEGIAADYSNLGILYGARGNLNMAEVMHLKSLIINEQLGHKGGIGRALVNLAGVYEIRGELDRACKSWHLARAIFDEMGAPHLVRQVDGWLEDAGCTNDS